MRLRSLSLSRPCAAAALAAGAPEALPLDKIKLPPGFRISVYARVPNARSMALSPGGTLFVGTRKEEVYAVKRGTATQGGAVVTIARGLRQPNGVAVRDGSLYVAEVSRILRFDGIDARLDDPPKAVVVRDDFPSDGHHGWKFIAFGPDGWLYVPVGAPCNICESQGAGLRRDPPDASGRLGRRALRERDPQHGRLRLGPAHQGALVHRQRAGLARRRHAAGRARSRPARGNALRLPVLPRQGHFRSGVRKEAALRGLHASRDWSWAPTSRRSACASTPARCSRPSTATRSSSPSTVPGTARARSVTA